MILFIIIAIIIGIISIIKIIKVIGIIGIITLPILILFFIIRGCRNKNRESVSDNQKDIEKQRYNEAQGYYRNQRRKQKEDQSQSQKQEQTQSETHAHTQQQDQDQDQDLDPDPDPDKGQDLSKYYAFIDWLKELQNSNRNQSQNQSEKYEDANRETKKSATNDKEPKPKTETEASTSFNEKYDKDKRYKCKCGIYVKSKDERSIADFLFENNIPFEYEREYQYNVKWNKKVLKTLHPDFFIKGPVTYKGRKIEKVYIEYWGLDTPEYLKIKEYKLKVYNDNKTTLISLYPEDILDCEKSLPVKLTQYKERQINYEDNNTFRA